MAKIMLDHPRLGTARLVRLVRLGTMLAERLRETGARLLHDLDGGR